MAAFNRDYLRKKNRKRRIAPVLIAGIVLVIISLYLSFRIVTFHLLPRLWRLLLMAVIVLFALICLVLSMLRQKKGRILIVFEIMLCLLMAVASVTLPYIEKKVENLFRTRIRVDVQDFHVFTFTAEYRAEHPDLPLPESVSENLLNYRGKAFLYPQSDSKAQQMALDKVREDLGGDLFLNQKATLWEALMAFYEGRAECILLSDIAVDMLEDTAEYSELSNDTLILRTIRTEVEVEEDLTKKISDKAFTAFLAGNDTRSGVLSIYGRTDVDILLTVNPETAQALIVSIPRDTYLKNPALGHGLDKLTHLGNNGIMNTVEGLNDLYGLEVQHYATVNFATFQKIIDTLGGIDIYNPYAFENSRKYFPAGDIHLNGEDALIYVRVRYDLANGDFDRNEHQAIVLKAILQKLTSREILEKAPNLINSLSGAIATNIDPASILDLASEELTNRRNWNIIYYHLGGFGHRAETVSMPGWSLYVVDPYETQTKFVHDEIMNVLTGEILEQKELPDADKTVWEYN